MKKFIFIVAIALLSAGCGVLETASGVAKHSYIGMPVDEFKKFAGSAAELDALNANGAVYRIDQHNIGIPDYIVSSMFFYFNSAGHLTEIETRHFSAPFLGGYPDSEISNP